MIDLIASSSCSREYRALFTSLAGRLPTGKPQVSPTKALPDRTLARDPACECSSSVFAPGPCTPRSPFVHRRCSVQTSAGSACSPVVVRTRAAIAVEASGTGTGTPTTPGAHSEPTTAVCTHCQSRDGRCLPGVPHRRPPHHRGQTLTQVQCAAAGGGPGHFPSSSRRILLLVRVFLLRAFLPTPSSPFSPFTNPSFPRRRRVDLACGQRQTESLELALVAGILPRLFFALLSISLVPGRTGKWEPLRPVSSLPSSAVQHCTQPSPDLANPKNYIFTLSGYQILNYRPLS